MREFKNLKARELFLESLRLDEIARKTQEKEIKQLGVAIGENGSGEIFTEAAGLRILADDIEDGLIDEDEIDL